MKFEMLLITTEMLNHLPRVKKMELYVYAGCKSIDLSIRKYQKQYW